MAIYAFGDLQGCYGPFRRLLDELDFDPAQDRLWLVGDLVNRGRESLAVLRFVRALGEAAVTVLGNHDLHLVAAAWDPAQVRPRDTFGDVMAAPDLEELADWLRRLPLLHSDRGLGYAMSHAGIWPGWDLDQAQAAATELEAALAGPDYGDFLDHMYGDTPDAWGDDLAGRERLRFITNVFTRMRYLTADGRLELAESGHPDRAPAGLVPWFRARGRVDPGVSVVFGHWSTLGRVPDPGIWSLDTGCVWGGTLTALRLDADPPVSRALSCPRVQRPG